MSIWQEALLVAVLGYAAGSIPFGLLLSLAAGKGDIRKIGSGNIGATNVLRSGSKLLAAATLLLDLLKGYFAVFLAGQWAPDYVPLAAFAVILGHCFPVWLGFKGGKGVATNAGVCFALAWPIGLAYAAVWIGVLASVRISSVAGMSAVVAAVAAAVAFTDNRGFVALTAAIAVLVIYLHRANIRRLLNGTEPRIGKKKG